jgi:uncharacterized protein
MKRIICVSTLFVLAAVSLGVLAGCDVFDSRADGSRSAADKRFLKFGSAPVGGAFFVMGDALAQVINDNRPEGMGKFNATATKGSQHNIRKLDKGQIDFALSNAAISYFAVRGEDGWEQAYDIRAVMTLAPNIALFLTRKDSGIETIADLKGKRVTIGPAGAGFELFVRPLVEGHGVSFDDFTPLYASQGDAVEQLGDGASDAAFLGGAVPTASIIQACSSMDIHFIPFDPEVRLKLIEKYPFFHPATLPAGTYKGLAEDFDAMNVGSMHIITHADQDDDVVYHVTKAVYENREAVIQKHKAGNAIRPQIVVRNTGTEFHPGAIRYYREIGIWPDDAQ